MHIYCNISFHNVGLSARHMSWRGFMCVKNQIHTHTQTAAGNVSFKLLGN